MHGQTSASTVHASLTELSVGGYAINFHESVENIGNYIARCDITGMTADSMNVTV